MSELTYTAVVSPTDKPLSWLHGEVKTPPFSKAARIEAGFLLRKLQRGESLAMPHSRAMPSIAPRCHDCESSMLAGIGALSIGLTVTLL
jgi:hypothetical protein